MGKKGDKTKQQIRAAAFDLFAEHGYTRVTMQNICEKTGLSKGGLYRHYEDKCQLFTDILRSLQKDEDDRRKWKMEQGVTAIDLFNDYLEHVKQHLSKASPSINIAIYEFCVEHKDGAGGEILSRQFRNGQANLLSLMKYGISEGSFHLTDPQGAVSAILFLVEGLLMVNEVMPVPEETINEVFNQIKVIAALKCADGSQHEK